MTTEPAFYVLHGEMMKLLAYKPTKDVIDAMILTLGCIGGMATDNLLASGTLVDYMAHQAKEEMGKNWGVLQEARAIAPTTGETRQ